jgi:hypothetical protein
MENLLEDAFVEAQHPTISDMRILDPPETHKPERHSGAPTNDATTMEYTAPQVQRRQMPPPPSYHAARASTTWLGDMARQL